MMWLRWYIWCLSFVWYYTMQFGSFRCNCKWCWDVLQMLNLNSWVRWWGYGCDVWYWCDMWISCGILDDFVNTDDCWYVLGLILPTVGFWTRVGYGEWEINNMIWIRVPLNVLYVRSRLSYEMWMEIWIRYGLMWMEVWILHGLYVCLESGNMKYDVLW